MNYKFVTGFLLLLGVNSFAGVCPDLTGSFRCNFQANEGAEKIVTLSQTKQDKTTTFVINGSSRIADGHLHSTAIEGLSEVKYTAECDGNVVIHLDAKVLNAEGRVVGDMFSHLILYRMNNLLHFYEMGSYDLETEYTPYDREATCQPVE